MLEKNPFELNDLLASSSVRLWLWLTDWLWKETMTNHIDNKWRDLIDIDVAKNWRQSLIVRKVIEWSFQRRIFLFLKTNVYRWTLLTSEIIKMSKYLHHPFHSLPNRCKKTSCRLRFFFLLSNQIHISRLMTSKRNLLIKYMSSFTFVLYVHRRWVTYIHIELVNPMQ
jgi:hypothetical protein